jgi:hypothetical protein
MRAPVAVSTPRIRTTGNGLSSAGRGDSVVRGLVTAGRGGSSTSVRCEIVSAGVVLGV